MPRTIARTKKNQFSNAECFALTVLEQTLSIGCHQSCILFIADTCGFDQQETINALQELETKQLVISHLGQSQRIYYKLSDNGIALVNQHEIYAFKAQSKLNNSELHRQLSMLSNATMCVMFMPNTFIEYLYGMFRHLDNDFIFKTLKETQFAPSSVCPRSNT